VSAIPPATAGTAWFLEGISTLQNQQAQVQRELSSGYRVQDASDAPAQTPELVLLGSNLAQVQAYQTNLTRVQSEASTADQSLGAAISLVQNAQTLAAEGANSTTSASTRQTLAGQIQGIQQQLVSIAGTTVEGRYIFGGDNDASAPYQYDASSATGVDRLTPQVATRAIASPAGQTVYQSLSAQQIFDPEDSTGAPTAANTFAALQSLVTALNANDTAGITTAVTSLNTSSTYLDQQQAYYGNAEQRLTGEQNTSANQATALQVQISGIRDTDVTQAATQLTQLSTDESAAYAAQAAIPVKSLFDYLG
jgi:flagellar hook-associated protein 3 FlgL